MKEQDSPQVNPVEKYKEHIHLMLRARFNKNAREEDAQLDELDHWYLQCDEVGRNLTHEYVATVIAPIIYINGMPTELPPLYEPPSPN